MDERKNEDAVSTPAEGGATGAVAGGLGGAVAGAAVGTVTAGPIGTIAGAVAGAVGGTAAGLAAGGQAEVDPEHDERYREHYEESPERLADRSYRQVRPAYQLGHFAGRDPRYLGRNFEEVEPDLQHAWLAELRDQHGEWEAARRFVRHAWEHVRGHPGDQQGRVHLRAAEPIGGTEHGSHERASFSDPIAPGDPDGVMGAKE